MEIYDAMAEDSEEWLEDLPADGEENVLRYKGMLTKLFVKMEYGTANYSRIVNMLRSMGCIEQIRRGSGTTEGLWLLWKRPDEELFNWVKESEAVEQGRQEDGSIHDLSVEQRMRDLQNQMLNLRSLVMSFDDRIEAIEQILEES